MSGGAGYVLSREALHRFVERAIDDKSNCRQDGGGAEDVEIGKCLAAVGVEAGDSRDRQGRHRMLWNSVASVVIPEASDAERAAIGANGRRQPDWWYDYTFYPYVQVNNLRVAKIGILVLKSGLRLVI